MNKSTSQITNCLTCGKELRLSPSQVGRKKYCSRECHWRPDLWVSKQCELCGEEFTCRAGRQGRGRFCSRPCAQKGIANDHSTRAIDVRACAVCGKSFQVKKSSTNKTCSPSCGNKLRGMAAVGKDSRIEKYCVTCGKLFLSYEYRNTICCSTKCMGGHLTRTRTGVKVNSTSGICANCGKTVVKPRCRIERAERVFCNKRCYHEWDKEYKNTPQIKRRSSQQAIANIVNGAFDATSKVEDVVAAWLDGNCIEYERQVLFGRKVADFKVGSAYVEVHGCYWHGCTCSFTLLTDHQRARQTSDKKFATYCRNRGVKLYTIWEHDVRANCFDVLSDLLIREDGVKGFTTD